MFLSWPFQEYDYNNYMNIEIVDAMPDRIKEAEEYADKLYSVMR